MQNLPFTQDESHLPSLTRGSRQQICAGHRRPCFDLLMVHSTVVSCKHALSRKGHTSDSMLLLLQLYSLMVAAAEGPAPDWRLKAFSASLDWRSMAEDGSILLRRAISCERQGRSKTSQHIVGSNNRSTRSAAWALSLSLQAARCKCGT